MRMCAIPGCNRRHSCRDLCEMHYKRLRTHGSTDSPRPSTLERFWSHVDIGQPDECWPWTSALTTFGYGAFRLGGKTVRANRYIVDAPVGSVVRHTCDNPPCVNPAHLLIGTGEPS